VDELLHKIMMICDRPGRNARLAGWRKPKNLWRSW